MTDLKSEQITKRENPFKDLSPCVLKRVSTENIIDYVYDEHTQSAYDLQKILKEKEIAAIRAEVREQCYEEERQDLHNKYREKVKILEEELNE